MFTMTGFRQRVVLYVQYYDVRIFNELFANIHMSIAINVKESNDRGGGVNKATHYIQYSTRSYIIILYVTR